MEISAFAQAMGVEILSLPDPSAAIHAGYTSDLLSDVMAHCPDGAVLITVQNHKNTVAVCTLVGVSAILVTHGRDIPPDMLEAAAAERISLLRTPMDQFQATCAASKALGIGH